MYRAPLIPRPGVRYGTYPERLLRHEPWPLYWAEWARARLQAVPTPTLPQQANFLRTVHQHRAKLKGCSIEFVVASIKRLRARLVLEGLQPALVAEIFALIDACLHGQWNVSLHDPQLLAGWLLLDRRLIEMHTGEGKTLAVALAAATGALAGIPVHVITANDYLVERDVNLLGQVFQAIGLTASAVTATTPGTARSAAYRADIVYCTAKELAFDYLRDHVASSAHGDRANRAICDKPERYLRGLCMAIIDEADSVLIDEARMPLILSDAACNTEQTAFYRQALFLAAQLRAEVDYRLDMQHRYARLTPEGQDRAQKLAERVGGGWQAKRRREETLCMALAARHLFVKDRHYLVQDHKIVIIDETTGRQAQGRVWSRGLHQLIEVKEGCPVTQAQQTAAQTTFQRFFARYLRLSGISGTLAEAGSELMAMYGLPVAKVPLRFPCRRLMLPAKMFANRQAQWSYVVRRVAELQQAGRPVLIGTDSVDDSEGLSAQLMQAGIAHTVLNARFDAQEARIIAKAGQRGAVTVSTNMAGRGTDIALAPGIALLGGLHVIACQTNDSARIDRQLYGRCARQGEPGSVEHLHCLHDGRRPLSLPMRLMLRLLQSRDKEQPLSRWTVLHAAWTQARRRRYRRQEQWFLFLKDKRIDRQFIFAGPNE